MSPPRVLPSSPTPISGVSGCTGSDCAVGNRDAKMEGVVPWRPTKAPAAAAPVPSTGGTGGCTGLHSTIFWLPEAKGNQPQMELLGLPSKAQPRPSRKRRKVTSRFEAKRLGTATGSDYWLRLSLVEERPNTGQQPHHYEWVWVLCSLFADVQLLLGRSWCQTMQHLLCQMVNVIKHHVWSTLQVYIVYSG